MTPWQRYQAIYPESQVSFFLDSPGGRGALSAPFRGRGNPAPTYSYLGAGPFLEVTVQKGKMEVRGEEKGDYPAEEFIPLLRRLLKKYRTPHSPSRSLPLHHAGGGVGWGREVRGAPFFSGAVGFFGYDLATLFEKLPLRTKPDPGTPWLYLGFYREVIAYDQKQKVPGTFLGLGPKKYLVPSAFHLKHFRPDITRSEFESMVRRAKQYIAAGDIYQANLSQRFSFEFEGSPLALYDRLREINPSPFASFLKIGDLHIVSSSPELLVRKRGRRCETRPIAGTRPRRAPHRSSRDLEHELLASPKERAEHLMLVDLERNDLGRVCDFKSIKVEEFMNIERYSHVIHLVSKITGRLARDKDVFDLIHAVFPGGTITGCPKIRCMEIIDELEPVRRGIYTGSIGWLGFNGDLDLNIVIRTLVLKGNRGWLQVGAGIVADSDPAREYEETLHKGEALVEALVGASV